MATFRQRKLQKLYSKDTLKIRLILQANTQLCVATVWHRKATEMTEERYFKETHVIKANSQLSGHTKTENGTVHSDKVEGELRK